MGAQKIGVLTFHRCINYGSYWQARSLVEGLCARGHDSLILDHNSPRANNAESRCALNPTLPTPTPAPDRPLYDQKIRGFSRAIDALPLSSRFSLDHPGSMDGFDIVVVGSDEVWNLFHPWYGGEPFFYGEGVKAQRLISYAASFGNYPASRGLDPHWAHKLRNFGSISVRDVNSQLLVMHATGMAPDIVLDPCLQFPVEHENRTIRFKAPYMAVYGHNFTQAFARQVREAANRRTLRLISIGYRNDWADEQWLSADPLDFAALIAQADAVVTNFFHGCVFSLRNSKPFVCESSSYRSLKVQGLLSSLLAERHLITSGTPGGCVDACLAEPLDPQIGKRISQLRQSSDVFLDQALASQEVHCV